MSKYLVFSILLANLLLADDPVQNWNIDTEWNQSDWKKNVYESNSSTGLDSDSSHNFNLESSENSQNEGG